MAGGGGRFFRAAADRCALGLQQLRQHGGRGVIQPRPAPQTGDDGRMICQRRVGQRGDAVDHLDRCGGQTVLPRVGQDAPFAVGLRHQKRRDRHPAVKLGQRLFLQRLFGAKDRLKRIRGEQALVKLGMGHQNRLVAEQDVEKLELRQITPQHHKAHGQGRGQDQPQRPPEEGPEDRGDDDGQRADPGSGPVKPGLDHVRSQKLDGDEQRCGPQDCRPVGHHGKGEKQRKGGGKDRPDIGHKAQNQRQHAPKQSVRHADQPQPDADGHRVDRVHQKLHQKIRGDTRRGLFHHLCGAVQIVRPDQPQKAVAQLFPLQKDEDHDDNHDTGACKGGDQRQDKTLQHADGAVGFHHLDHHRSGG